MKLHYHPVSTTSRPILLFVQENNLPVELKVVDLMTGEHVQEPYTQLNPNQLVPLLEEGNFRLTESAAILKYLAEKFESPLYPRDLQKRAKVNEAMDWLNTQLNRELCYGLVYPQVFPHHKRPSDDVQSATLAWSKERATKWLSILDEHILGSDQRYLAGNELTIADYYATGFVSLGELIRVDYKQFPNLNRWLEQVKKEIKSYAKVNEVFYGFAGSLKDQAFASI
ncbi:MAG TPA: glutathione S-transferase family protein [Polyangiaceae bacterium]|nr:glutathione S-transferase family protein [Polyangiaceae bacterium]